MNSRSLRGSSISVIDPYAIFRSGELGSVIPPAPASADAQSTNTGGPLNIRHIRRGHAVNTKPVTLNDATNGSYTLNYLATSWQTIPGGLTVSSSGRPLIIDAGIMVGIEESSALDMSFMVDGVEVTGRTYGLARKFPDWNDAGTYGYGHLRFFWVVENPTPGTHTVNLAAKLYSPYSSAGVGYLYAGTSDMAILAAREI